MPNMILNIMLGVNKKVQIGSQVVRRLTAGHCGFGVLPSYRSLTYMATIAQALRGGVLETFQLPTWEVRQPVRPLFVAPDFFDWVENTQALYDEQLKKGGKYLVDHLEQMFCDFCCADHPGAGEIRRVEPTRHGIIKLQPYGSRVIGWCPAPHQFVAVKGVLKMPSGNWRIVSNAVTEVRAFIKSNNLGGTVLRGELNALFPR